MLSLVPWGSPAVPVGFGSEATTAVLAVFLLWLDQHASNGQSVKYACRCEDVPVCVVQRPDRAEADGASTQVLRAEMPAD